MKATLKYPIFQFSPDENMVYTFWKENKTTQLALLKECKGWNGDIVIDSTGTKYTVRRSYMTGWKGIHGFTGMSTGMISYETEYEDNPEPFSGKNVGTAWTTSAKRFSLASPLRNLPKR